MKATELRIGNYYQYASDYGITYAQVQEIKHNQFGLLGDFDGTNFGICQPIPLTEEWLLRFGFDRHIKFSNHNGWLLNGWFINSKNYDFMVLGSSVVLAKIKHIHQLQNLYFALTGEELTLKNK